MPVTTKQIAEIAGVSRGTVDRALNNRPGVNEATRKKILSIAERLRYVPNRAGKALSTAGRTLSIGIVLNCVDNPFYDDIIAGIEACRAAYKDFDIDFHYHRLKGYSALEQLDALRKLEDVQIILISPLNEPEVTAKINSLTENGAAVITLNSDIEYSKRLLHVGCNYHASGCTAAGILGLTLGSGTVGIVTGSLRMLGHRQRVKGFLEELGLRFPNIKNAWLIENNDDDKKSYDAVKNRLSKEPAISAVYFCAGGVFGGVNAIQEVLSSALPIIIACDDIPQTLELVKSGQIMATICQEPFRQGYEAMRLALEYHITGKRPAPDTIYMKNEIKILQNI